MWSQGQACPTKLLTPEAQQRLTPAAHLFCETPDCPVVYFAPDDGSVFHKPDLTVRVGIKETEPPIPLCYCFGFTREMLWSELAHNGQDDDSRPHQGGGASRQLPLRGNEPTRQLLLR
jgi:hypothetical protein